jgi:hypothetical protein
LLFSSFCSGIPAAEKKVFIYAEILLTMHTEMRVVRGRSDAPLVIADASVIAPGVAM